jgi:hypothetical protein
MRDTVIQTLPDTLVRYRGNCRAASAFLRRSFSQPRAARRLCERVLARERAVRLERARQRPGRQLSSQGSSYK